MVLADDNFATIAQAVEEGRTIYDNLKKAILFILPTNGAQALIVVAAFALGMTLPLTAVQILWVNMVSAVTLALALAFEPPEGDVMRRAPRRPDEPILSEFWSGGSPSSPPSCCSAPSACSPGSAARAQASSWPAPSRSTRW